MNRNSTSHHYSRKSRSTAHIRQVLPAICATTRGSSALPDRFWAKVDIRGEDDCWPYTGHIDRDGYGRYRRHGAHREAFRVANGHPAEHSVLHTCDSRSCCNPRHLYDGTQQENVRDRVARGRSATGARNGRYKSGLYVGGRHHPLKAVAP